MMDRQALWETLQATVALLAPDGRWRAAEVTALLMETAAVESGLGEIVRQKGGPALSPWQLQKRTYEEIVRHFARRDPGLLRRALALYDRSRPLAWNQLHNVPWNAAMSLLYYELATGGRFLSRIATLDQRARLWKERYNTPRGAGTVTGYKQRALAIVYGRMNQAPRMRVARRGRAGRG